MTPVLLATPPLMMPNGPYPATAYLTTRLLSRAFLPRLRQAAEQYAATQETVPPTVALFLATYTDYERTIDPVMAFILG